MSDVVNPQTPSDNLNDNPWESAAPPPAADPWSAAASSPAASAGPWSDAPVPATAPAEALAAPPRCVPVLQLPGIPGPQPWGQISAEAGRAAAHSVVWAARAALAGEVAGLIPGHGAPWVGAMFTPSDARAEPWQAVPLLAEGAVARGAVIVEDCAVRLLDVAAGRVAGVVTEQGRIACDQVVVAGGAWSSLFLRAHGVAIPQLAVLATVARTVALPQVFAGNAVDDRLAFRRRADGGYTIAPGAAHDFFIGPDAFRNFAAYLPLLKQDFRSTRFRPMAPRHYPDAWGTPRRWAGDEVSPFERIRVLNPAPNPRVLAQIRADFGRVLPGLGAPAIADAWAGMIDTMPDVVPVIDRAPQLPGLVIATGMCGHGFGIGPGMGRVVAALVAGDAPGHDLTRFRLSRFTDGSKLVVGTGL